MDLSLKEVETEVEAFEARPTLKGSSMVIEKLEYLTLEDNLTVNDRKKLKELKSRVAALDFNKPTNQHLLTHEEVFTKQRKLLYDCEKMGMNVSEELERQNIQLEGSNGKLQRIDGKLVSSSGLLLSIKRNIQKNRVMLRIVVYTLILVFLVILMMKVFG